MVAVAHRVSYCYRYVWHCYQHRVPVGTRVEGTHFHSAIDQDQNAKQEWAVHQIASTANFATNSKSLYWLLGGLNFQIEHHLFPRVSHIHYPKISQLVKETCHEYNIVYNEYASMFKAVTSHLVHLRKLGNS